jgi:hypothetical protein
MNFPLPGETGPAVMVKLYEDAQPKLNQMMEYVGVYEIGQGTSAAESAWLGTLHRVPHNLIECPAFSLSLSFLSVSPLNEPFIPSTNAVATY